MIRSNGDFLMAQDESQRFLVGPFKKYEAGQPLTAQDRSYLLKGARLCAALAAYLPGKAEAQDFTCGEALAALGYHEEAIHHYQLFLTFAGDNPTDPMAKVVRADSYGLMAASLTAMGKYKLAVDAANIALKAFPDTAAYLVDRASAESHLGAKSAAKADLTLAMKAAAADDPAGPKARAMLKQLGGKR
ncbi:MAG: hypothetical protein ACYC96_09415 [Fimbriimonadaceae bacterium]